MQKWSAGKFHRALALCISGDEPLPASLRLDVRRPDHLAPFFSFVSDELAEIPGREREHCATQISKARPQLGVGEGCINFFVELVDDLGGRAPGRTDAVPSIRVVARNELIDSREGR